MHFDTYAFFLVPIVVGLTAEVVKFLNYCRKYGWDITYSIAYGHMPSAHTAFVTSLATTVGFLEGWETAAFGVAVCFATIVIMDALRLRVYMGQQAKILNHLTAKLNLSKSEFPHLKERVGHKPSEVVVGGLFGIIVTFILLLI